MRAGLSWLAASPNSVGLALALIVAAALYGQTIETTLFPVLSEVNTSNVTVRAGRLKWTLDFCKRRNARLESVSFEYSWAGQKSLPVLVVNETRGEPVNTAPLSANCFSFNYSAALPAGYAPGGKITGMTWYHSTHPFWLIPQKFGAVTVPELPQRSRSAVPQQGPP